MAVDIESRYTSYAVGKTPEQAKKKLIAYVLKDMGQKTLNDESINVYKMIDGVTDEGK